MSKKILWLAVSCLMALSLVVAACGTAATPTPTPPAAPAPAAQQPTPAAPVAQPPQKEAVTPSKPVPHYGGTLNLALTTDWVRWDPTKSQAITVSHMQYTSNELMGGDWKKGPQGTGETGWEYGFLGDSTLEGPELADSWETPDDTTIIFRLHKGIHYQNIPPANGREMTAQDVVWNMEMQFNYPTAWQGSQYPAAKPAEVTGQVLPGGNTLRPTSFKALDKYTVEVKVPSESQALMLLEIGDNAYVSPPEVWTGTSAGQGLGMGDWKKVVGSGPYVITNLVPGSLVEMNKNPDYFEMDPLYPSNRWPYIQTIRLLVLPDLSTRQAAFRIGKLDMMPNTPEDGKLLIKQRPDLKYANGYQSTWVLSGRMDKQDLPYKDIRVRQALNLAVDKVAFLRDYFKGDGELLAYPYPGGKSWSKFYTSLDDMPKTPQLPGSQATVPELIRGGNIEKAKQLLKEAGYPNGFKVKVNMQATQQRVDEVSILKDMLAKVGVDLQLATMDTGAWNTMDINNNQEEMWYGNAKGIWAPHEQLMTKRNTYANDAHVDDPYYDNVAKVIGRDLIKNPANYFKTMKAEGIYELESAWGIWMPMQYAWRMYWPWVENYYGINWTGWANISDWYKGIWINEGLKKSMGY